ncbi:MAG: 3-keto-disaccharide hydrolase [Agriterribacter sp.]
MKRTIALSALWIICFSSIANAQQKWISLFNGKDLTGWTARGNARWAVKEGVITGQNGQGHLYAAPVVKDFEVKGEFRIIDQGKGANSGFYVRAHEPEDDPEGFPRGYEAQICNNTEAYTGWLWKPGKPTGKATALLTKDGEWFPMRVRVKGDSIFIWVKDQLVMTYRDQEYKEGKFAIQCHNPGMTAEARNLYYRKLD